MTLYYEDFEPNQVFESSGRTITETDITMFAMLSGDWNPIHTDAVFAKSTRYGTRIAHGVLGMAVAGGMLHDLGIFQSSAIAMYGFHEWKFLAPIVANDTVHLRLTIMTTSLGKSGNTGKLGRKFELINQHGVIVQEGSSDLLVRTRKGAEVAERRTATASS